MRHLSSITLIVLASLAGFSSTAAASFIDFRSSAHSAAAGFSDYDFTTADGVSATTTAGPTGAAISWESGDGLGVNYFDTAGTADEVDGVEYLTLSFGESVFVDQILITDLFVEGAFGYRTETGSASTNTGTTWFQSTGSSNGELWLDLGEDITSITFRAKDSWGHDFSLGGISAVRSAVGTQVPELDPSAGGSAMALLLGGLACVIGRRRR